MDLLLTDPPFNTSRPNNFGSMGRTGIDFHWDGHFDQVGWLRLVEPALRPGAVVVIWNDWKNLGLIAAALEHLGIEVKRDIALEKLNPFPRNINRSTVQRLEHGLWAVKKGAPWIFNRSAAKPYEDGVFRYPVPGKPARGRARHEAAKPVAAFMEIIRLWSNPGDLVLDPFVGGGTTAVAAKLTDRRCVCFERMRRWYNETRLRLKET